MSELHECTLTRWAWLLNSIAVI